VSDDREERVPERVELEGMSPGATATPHQRLKTMKFARKRTAVVKAIKEKKKGPEGATLSRALSGGGEGNRGSRKIKGRSEKNRLRRRSKKN